MWLRLNITIAIGLCLLLVSTAGWATALGLNQISTPDIQPEGLLAISAQAENDALGNPRQIQLEVGLTSNFEVAVFQGFEPVKAVFNAEYGIINNKPWLLSVGLLGTQAATKYQPFAECGYYSGNCAIIAGIQRQEGVYFGVFGGFYQATPKIRVAADYISGGTNFATIGVTYAITPTLSFNPALYVSNSSPHPAFGYGVVTWEVKVW